MLRALRELLRPAPEQGASVDTEHRVRLAAAVLLLEIAWADFDLQEAELAAVGRALGRSFGLDARQVDLLLEAAQAAHEEDTSLYPHLQEINRAFSLDEKERLIEQMWRVALSDSVLDKYEEGQIRRIADLLYLPHSRFIRAKLRAQARESTADEGRTEGDQGL